MLEEEEAEALMLSQRMTLRWERSQIEFSQTSILEQSSSQYGFEVDENSQMACSMASETSTQPKRLEKKRPSFRLTIPEAARQSAESLRRQNSYSNTTCSTVLYGDDSNTPRTPVTPRLPQRIVSDESLMEALRSAPVTGSTKHNKQKRELPPEQSEGVAAAAAAPKRQKTS
eukprot:NODE_1926_length_708_cov_49.813354_g36_i1.p1 GENE.NODE_1926_length_708_cov_49.813354_g36_i1~~NODE_1926_length_708_cov_49.813354_g36_i1.p1  ORF type:complete len:172 (+),score=53.15 NODE_1926_length_708_cov_49.813354_g36_i1:47-562(+)